MENSRYTLEFNDYDGNYSVIDKSTHDKAYSGMIIADLSGKNQALQIMNALNKAYLEGYMDGFSDGDSDQNNLRELTFAELKELSEEELQKLTDEWQEHLKKARGE